MSLRHALLGLLADSSASGYELSQRFAGDLGRYAWPAGHTAIYPELGKMADAGLITVEATGPRGRKTYGLTEAGRSELRGWLLDWSELTVGRNELVLRMFLVGQLDAGDARPLLEGIAGFCDAELERIRPQMAEMDAEHGLDATPFGRLAGEYGLRLYETLGSWARWALARLDARAGAGPTRA